MNHSYSLKSIKGRIRSVRRTSLKWLKENSLARFMVLIGRLIDGIKTYHKTGHTPPVSYYAMRELYAKTDGRINALLATYFRLRYRRYKFNGNYNGIFSNSAKSQLIDISYQIKRDGCYVFPWKLSKDTVSKIYNFVSEIPCFPHPSSPERLISYNSLTTSYPGYLFDNPTYPISTKLLLQSVAVQDIIFDESILFLVQAYLGCKPVLTSVACWWSVPLCKEPEFGSAQFYHYDMGRLKFIKFFFYLTDVTSENGPHCYVKRSHRSKPKSLRADKRKTDEEVYQCYSDDQCIEICGDAGTIIAADTSGLHKGKAVKSGCRLILQLEYSVSLFGADYERMHILACREEVQKMIKTYSETYTLFSYSK